jgi:hypothetical protein
VLRFIAIVGDGPLLLLITGAMGDAGFYSTTAALVESEDLRKYTTDDKDYVIKYFMRLMDHVSTEALRFY